MCLFSMWYIGRLRVEEYFDAKKRNVFSFRFAEDWIIKSRYIH